jgi:elongation factor P
MISATQIKRGMAIKLNGELYRVFSFQHITPGNWRGMVQTKLKSIKSGSIVEHRFRSEDRIEQAYLETHEVEYLYSDGSDYYFMNTETFEQFHLSSDWLEDAIPYMLRLNSGWFLRNLLYVEQPLAMSISRPLWKRGLSFKCPLLSMRES